MNLRKLKAIELRKEGKTYSEILKEIIVAKSTLSIWLREVGLAKRQVQRITEKRIEAQKKGARAKHAQAVERREKIYSMSALNIGSLSEREIWLLATALYWAEGGKEKIKMSGGPVFNFSNTDPRMLRLFLYWVTRINKIPLSSLSFEIYIHKYKESGIEAVKKYWSKELDLPVSVLGIIRYKNHNIKTNRKNIGNLYNGLVRVKVFSSSTLVRQMEGWAQGIDSYMKERITIDP